MEERAVVTCLLRHRGAVLLLRPEGGAGRAGRWDGITGPAGGDPIEAARRTLRERAGLGEGEFALVRGGEPFVVGEGTGGSRRVHPFLFDCETGEVALDPGPAEREWCAPTAIRHRETVPGLWEAYDRVRPTVGTVATDREHGAAHISVRALEVLRDEAAVASDGDGVERLTELARDLLAARPAMSVVQNRVNRVMHATRTARTPRAVEHAAAIGIAAAVTADERAADRATAHVDGKRVATLSRSGTVLEALRRGEPAAVLVAESRPGGEGVDVAEALAEETAVTLTTDAGFAHALAEWEADTLLVGADTVVADGRVLNKAGTRGAAMVSSYEGISVIVTAAADKLAADAGLDLEPRSRAELYDGDEELAVRNHTFDVTPAACVDVVVTEHGALDIEDAGSVAARHRRLAEWDG